MALGCHLLYFHLGVLLGLLFFVCLDHLRLLFFLLESSINIFKLADVRNVLRSQHELE